MPLPRRPGVIQRSLLMTTVALIVWLILTAGAPALIPAGIGVSLVTGAVMAALSGSTPSSRLSLGRAIFWVPGFLVGSVIGGVDVALRVLRPSLPVDPRFYEHKTSLPPGWPRAAYTGVISLMPGTLAAGSQGDRIHLHLLSGQESLTRGVQREERRLSAVVRPDPTAAP